MDTLYHFIRNRGIHMPTSRMQFLYPSPNRFSNNLSSYRDRKYRKAVALIHTTPAASDMFNVKRPEYNNTSLRYIGCRTTPKTPSRSTDGVSRTFPKTILNPDQAQQADEHRSTIPTLKPVLAKNCDYTSIAIADQGFINFLLVNSQIIIAFKIIFLILYQPLPFVFYCSHAFEKPLLFSSEIIRFRGTRWSIKLTR